MRVFFVLQKYVAFMKAPISKLSKSGALIHLTRMALSRQEDKA